jgi:hypothetical protein
MEPAEVLPDPKSLGWLYDYALALLKTTKSPIQSDAAVMIASEFSFAGKAKATIECGAITRSTDFRETCKDIFPASALVGLNWTELEKAQKELVEANQAWDSNRWKQHAVDGAALVPGIFGKHFVIEVCSLISAS